MKKKRRGTPNQYKTDRHRQTVTEAVTDPLDDRQTARQKKIILHYPSVNTLIWQFPRRAAWTNKSFSYTFGE